MIWRNIKVGSNLERVLFADQFAVTAEIGPPKSANIEAVAEKIELLRGNVDAVNVTDCQTAVVRMSSMSVALMLRDAGVEPVMQMTCRDRNRIAIQSDILGAAGLGIKNILCLTGDHQCFGNHPDARGVFDLDSISLIKMVKGMRDGHFECGEEMDVPPKLFIGAAENPFADPFEFRVARLAKKVEAGVDFIQTQIVYNIDKFAKFMEEVVREGLDKEVYIMAGVAPLKSAGMAKYMKNRVPGMDVPDKVIERMQKAEDPKAKGIEICVDVIKKVREIPGVAGAHIMAVEWEEAVQVICEKAKLVP
jgi:5,10-methylenetetrahydrofolate reductase